MQTSTTCLQADELKSFIAGELPEQRITDVEEHLSTCAICCEALENTAGDRDWWNDVEHALGADPLAAFDESVHDEQQASGYDRLIELLGPTDDPSMMGRIGSYEIVGILGQGGMGAVFKAFDAGLHRYVAIKVLLPHLASSGAARARFRREGQAAAAVIDDHVLPIYAVDEWQGTPYLVMQYTRGVSLQKRLHEQGPLEVREILRIGLHAARGLAAAHAQGLVHRDVKPSNILLDSTVERSMLTDFGLARAVDDASLTASGIVAGTPQYMSPEQARAEAVDGRSDLFSLGSVLYAMCTGHAPFRAESSIAVLRLIADKQPRPIREINPNSPEWLCAIIGKLMSKQGGDRFDSAERVAELLEGCLAHIQQPTTTPLPESIAALAPQRNRRPPFIKLIAAAAFAFSLIFAGVLIVLELNKGTLEIESEADDVPIRVIQGESIVRSLTVNKSGKTIRIAAGQYVIEVGGDLSGINVQDSSVSLARGATEVVRIAVVENTLTPDRKLDDRTRRLDMGEAAQRNATEVVPESTQWSKAVQGLRLGVRFDASERGRAQKFAPGDVGHLQIYLQNVSDKAIRAGFEPTDACKAVFQISSQDGSVIAHYGSQDSEQFVVPAPLSANFRELKPGEIRPLNNDFAGTATPSPARKLRLDDIASFMIVDNDQSSDAFPRQYRLPPEKYFVSITLELYSEQNRFTMTSDRLPFEVVEAMAVIETVTENVPVRVTQGETVTQQLKVTKEGKSTHTESSSGKYGKVRDANPKGAPTVKRVDGDEIKNDVSAVVPSDHSGDQESRSRYYYKRLDKPDVDSNDSTEKVIPQLNEDTKLSFTVTIEHGVAEIAASSETPYKLITTTIENLQAAGVGKFKFTAPKEPSRDPVPR